MVRVVLRVRVGTLRRWRRYSHLKVGCVRMVRVVVARRRRRRVRVVQRWYDVAGWGYARGHVADDRDGPIILCCYPVLLQRRVLCMMSVLQRQLLLSVLMLMLVHLSLPLVGLRLLLLLSILCFGRGGRIFWHGRRDVRVGMWLVLLQVRQVVRARGRHGRRRCASHESGRGRRDEEWERTQRDGKREKE